MFLRGFHRLPLRRNPSSPQKFHPRIRNFQHSRRRNHSTSSTPSSSSSSSSSRGFQFNRRHAVGAALAVSALCLLPFQTGEERIVLADDAEASEGGQAASAGSGGRRYTERRSSLEKHNPMFRRSRRARDHHRDEEDEDSVVDEGGDDDDDDMIDDDVDDGRSREMGEDDPSRAESSSSSSSLRQEEEIPDTTETQKRRRGRTQEPTHRPHPEQDRKKKKKKKRKSRQTRKAKRREAIPIFAYIETAEESPIKIFAGSGNPSLASQVASLLGAQLGRATVGQYADGECKVAVHDNVRGQTCYIVQSISQSPNDRLLELLLMASSLKRASCDRVVAVIPYLSYSRQLRSKYNAQSLGGADVALLLEAAGVDHIVAIDLHRAQIQGFFEKIPVENLDTTASAVPYFSRKELVDPVVVAPSGGTVERATRFRDHLARLGVQADMALLYTESAGQFVDTEEEHHTVVEKTQKMHVVGDVEERDCIIIDDMVDSGSRVAHAAEALHNNKARRIFAYTTHGLLTGDAVDRIEDSPLNELVICNTIPLPSEKWSPMIRQLSVAGLLAECILRMHNQESVLEMFED